MHKDTIMYFTNKLALNKSDFDVNSGNHMCRKKDVGDAIYWNGLTKFE